jgi:COMPASS component SWD3
MVSGKDKQIRLWDAIGGMCVQTLADCLGEITSVEFDREGKYLLAGCKDNSNRLFDLRMVSNLFLFRRTRFRRIEKKEDTRLTDQQRNIYRYTGTQNTSKNLIRSHFGSNDQLVISGSEDGLVYIWPTQSASDSDSSSVPNNSNIVPPNKASPAYYPPRDLRQAQNTSTKTQSGVTVVKPIRTLEGHGEGAVFDVVWTEEGVFSAGEDGMVGVWGYDPEDEA